MEGNATTTKERLLGKTAEELKEATAKAGLPPYASSQVARWLYRQGATSFEQMTNVSKAGRERLSELYAVGRSEHLKRAASADGTVKYLFPTSADAPVEAVFIPDGERGTLCVSSQAGCRMRCLFCMTGRQGYQGNLTAGDIVNQVYSLPERESLTNIVFMGQGEPLDNLDGVLSATRLLTADYGFAWSPRRITISTVGVRGKLERLLNESECHVAVSLHSPFPQQRLELVPAERAYSLEEFMPLLRSHDWHGQRRLSFEYVVLNGVNDSPAHARELARLLARLECRVNLIRFHEIPNSPLRPAPEATMLWLRDYLTRHHITTTIRASRGQDIMAACGLLNTASTPSP